MTREELISLKKNLDDDFEIEVELPKSDSSKSKYNFLITKSDRENVKIREISLETAIENYPLSATLEYFEKHLNEFKTLNGDQITEFVKSDDGNRRIKFNSYPYKKYEFLEWKKGVDGNLRVWPGGTRASSLMYSLEEWSVENDTLIINSAKYILKELNNNYYLLIYKSDNSVAGLMQ